jgi:hypothetical protein
LERANGQLGVASMVDQMIDRMFVEGLLAWMCTNR